VPDSTTRPRFRPARPPQREEADHVRTTIEPVAPNPAVYAAYLTDINSGECGGQYEPFLPFFIEATYNTAWDNCTGWGTPHGRS
jgi:hypothetical protein